MMVKYFLAPLLALAVAAAACKPSSPAEESESEPRTESAQPAPDPAMELTADCANPVEGYALRYPADWRVNTGEILSPCSLFDPEPIDIPRHSEIPIDIAIMIDVESAPFETLTADVLGRRDVSRQETTVNGRRAMRIEGESTGEGLYDRGTRSYQYFVDLGDSTMVASTYDAGSLSFDRKHRILDAMMETVAFR